MDTKQQTITIEFQSKYRRQEFKLIHTEYFTSEKYAIQSLFYFLLGYPLIETNGYKFKAPLFMKDCVEIVSKQQTRAYYSLDYQLTVKFISKIETNEECDKLVIHANDVFEWTRM